MELKRQQTTINFIILAEDVIIIIIKHYKKPTQVIIMTQCPSIVTACNLTIKLFRPYIWHSNLTELGGVNATHAARSKQLFERKGRHVSLLVD